MFFDSGAHLIDASRHDYDRLGLIGYGASSRSLLVVHVEKPDQGLRIISARRATKAERRICEEQARKQKRWSESQNVWSRRHR